MSSISIAEKYEPKIYRALIDIFEALRKEFIQKEFIQILEEDGLQASVDYLETLVTEELIDFYLVNTLNNAINDGGNYFWEEVPKEAKETNYFAYLLFSYLTVNQVTNYQYNLAQTIKNNTLEGLRQKLYASYVPNINYTRLARELRNTIGLTAKQELAVRNYENNLRNLNRDALRRALRDKRFDPSILRSIKNGTPLTDEQINNMVNRYRERMINHRALTLARTEAYRAVSLGQYTAGIQALDAGAVDGNKVRRFWVHMHDLRVRDAHRAVPGMNPEGVPLDGYFQTPLGLMRYPRDPAGVPENVYNCRCWVKIKRI
jgi:hypothetical protein